MALPALLGAGLKSMGGGLVKGAAKGAATNFIKGKKTKVFRIISSIEPPLFSKIREIPVLESGSQIEHFLNTKKNNSKINKKKIIADFMFREDVKASNRKLKLNF